MNILLAIVANVLLLVAALGFGSLLQRLVPDSFSEFDRFLMTLLGGLGILGTILFCAGQIWFSRTAIISILFLGILMSRDSLSLAVRACRVGFAMGPPPVIPVAIVLSLIFVTAIGGLALPTGDMNNDSIAYHYLGPKVWVRNAVIRPVPDEVMTFFPVVVESQYAALMSLGGQRAPGFFAVIGLTSLLLSAASLAMRLGLDLSGAWWVMAVVATMPAVYRGAYGGFLDALLAGFVLAAARLAFDAEKLKDYVLFGIFCGIAMGTKYTAIIAFALLIFCSLVVSIWGYRRRVTTILKPLGITCATAVAVASPFYLRNWILYGCPIYPPPPVLLHFFTAKNMLPAVIQELVKAELETGRGMGRSLLDFFLLPFNLTYHTANFRGAGGIGLIPWALGPLGMIARRRDIFAKGILLFAFLQTTAWFVTAQESRFMIAVYVIGAVFGVLGWEYAARSVSRTARGLAATAVAISILYGAVMIFPDRVEDVHAALSRSFEIRRSQAETPRIASFDYVNGDPSVNRVLIVDGGIAAYFIDKPYIKPFGRWGEQTLPGVTNVAEVMSQLPELHVTHVFDTTLEDGTFYLGNHPTGLTLVFAHGNERVYRVD